MAEPRSEPSLIRYYCTAGNGMEPFLIDEVKRKLAAEDVRQVPGKVLFSSSAGIGRVCELKAAERLFLLLKQESPVRLSAHTSPAKAASVLQSRLLGDSNQWTSAVMTWGRLQRELADRRTTVNTPSTALGVTRKREEGRRSEEPRGEEKCHVESSKSTREQREQEEEVESGNNRQRSGEQNGARTLEKKRKWEKEKRDVERKREEETSGETCVEAQTLEKKRKVDDEEEEEEGRGAGHNSSGEKNVEKERTSEKERRREGEEEREMVMEFGSCRKNGKHGVVSGPDFNGGDHETPGTRDHNVENVKTTGGRDKTPLQPGRVGPEPSPVPVSFRVSCKCTGSLARYFSTQEVSRVIGVGLSRLLGWKADLKNPQLEVNVYLSDDHCLLGIPLTRLPLANRSYIKATGLRSTVAWAMVSLAQIQPGFCVVDPMCGVGTILIEAAQEHKDLQAVRFLGMDIDDGQLQKANENVEFAELGNRIHLLKASSMVLPLPSASVDAVVCDLPFGRKFGTKTNMAASLPLILTEMERVLCVGGTLVLLLSPQLSCLLKKLLAQKDAGPTSNQETTKQQTFQIHQGVKSPPTQETEPQSGLQHSPPPPLSSLKHQATLRVSLGMIDGLIHKYVKMDT